MQNLKRIYVLDEVRGFSIILMIIYHLFFSMSSFFNIESGSLLYKLCSPLQPFFAGVFIFISGMCSYFSHSNLKRGLKLLIISLCVTLITYIVMPEQIIVFGILHMLSVAMLLFAVFKKPLSKIPIYIGIAVFAVLFLLTYNVELGYIGVFSLQLFRLPTVLYKFKFLFPFGIHLASFVSSDYFPLVPWLFLFLCATFAGNFAIKKELPRFFYNKHSRLLCFIGRHSLIIYLLHQPIILGVLFIINKFI